MKRKNPEIFPWVSRSGVILSVLLLSVGAVGGSSSTHTDDKAGDFSPGTARTGTVAGSANYSRTGASGSCPDESGVQCAVGRFGVIVGVGAGGIVVAATIGGTRGDNPRQRSS